MVRVHRQNIAEALVDAYKECGTEIGGGWIELDETSQCYTVLRVRNKLRETSHKLVGFGGGSGGVGTEISKLLKWFHIMQDATCGCPRLAGQWDRLGVQWCKANWKNMARELHDRAKKKSHLLGALALVCSTLVVRYAIWRAS